jgi:hypothetical protein
MSTHAAVRLSVPLAIVALAGCASAPSGSAAPSAADAGRASPPPRIKAWMDRLTVAHAYDPKTGFIVARETVSLPPILADAPALDAAIASAGSERVVIAFATADRCAPCQQYKRDALNDAAVIARLSDPRFVPTHVEVDRAGDLAEAHLGGRDIPMTYALCNGRVVATLAGQRSGAELLAWLDGLPAG